MARKRSKAVRTSVGIGIVFALAAGLWGLGEWKPFAYKWPSQWDPRVAKLAGYVERSTKFRFKHPVRTRFLHNQEFEKLVTDDESSLMQDDRDFYKATSLLLRTLGVAKGNVDLFKDQNTLNAGNILAYYSPEDREMVIRLADAKDDGSKLSPALRATVVHELTHALQDQVFGLGRIREAAADSGQDEALTALIEGHAMSVEEKYVSDNFSDDEREQYTDATSGVDSPDLSAVPEIVSAQQMSAYVFGPTFVKSLQRHGRKTLIDAFLKKPPTSLEQTILPSKYFGDDNPEEISDPKLPKHAEPAVSGQISQLDLFFILVRTWNAPEALRLSDLWGNASYVGYYTEDEFCAAINMRGESESATDELRQAFGEWVKDPARKGARIEDHDNFFTVRACDPGAKADPDLPTADDTNQLFWRSGDISYIWQSEPGANAECVASGLYYEFTASELVNDSRVIDVYNELLSSCRRS
jgi:hypothetical protein